MTATAAGEYVALSRGNQASKHVSAVMRFFGNHTPHYHLYTDNQAAEHIATQPTMSEHSRSIDLRHHSIRQDYIENGMRIGGVSSKDNTADILTKALQPDLHTTHTSHLFPDRASPTTQPKSDAHTSSDVNNTNDENTPHTTHLQNMVTHAHYDPLPPPTTIIHRQANNNPAMTKAQLMWIAYLQTQPQQQNPQPSRDMKSPEQHNKRPKRGKKPFHRKDSPKQNQQHTNGRRQVFTKSTNYSPTQVQPRPPSKQATLPSQSLTSQPKFQNGSTTKGGTRRVSGKTTSSTLRE